LGGAPYQNIMI